MKHRISATKQKAIVSLWALILLLPLRATAQQANKNKYARKPEIPVRSLRFASGQSALKIPFDLSHNIVFVKAQLNNSQPLWFIFDTGASSSVVNARLAKELGLRVKGKEKGMATGGPIDAELIPGVSLSLPGVSVFNQTMASVPLDSLAPALGRAIDGIIGYDFIKRFVVEVDYGAGRMNLHGPSSYKYSNSGTVFPITLINGKPFVSARITPKGHESIEGRFMIDTGSDGALGVNVPFVQAHQLLKSASQGSAANSGGVGGISKSITVRVENIQLGRFIISNPLVSFSQATEGSEMRADYDGVLGGEIFRRFTLVLDYSRRRITLYPNAHLGEPVDEDMSGLELMAVGQQLVINEVAANSPAAEAGLLEEDELTAIDGRPVSDIGLEQIWQMFKQEGKEYLLSIKRGQQTLQVRIKLRRLI